MKIYASLLLKTIVILIALNLTACGFHLRQPTTLPPEFHAITLASYQASDPFHRELRRALHRLNVQIDPADPTQGIVLTLSGINAEIMPTGYGRDGQVHRQRLTYRIPFTVRMANTNQVLSTQTITIVRNHTVNPNDKLSSDDELVLIKQEVQKEAAHQLIQRLTKIKATVPPPLASRSSVIKQKTKHGLQAKHGAESKMPASSQALPNKGGRS